MQKETPETCQLKVTEICDQVLQKKNQKETENPLFSMVCD